MLNLVEPLAALLLLWLYHDGSTPLWQLVTWATLVISVVFLRLVAGQLLRHLDTDAASLRAWRISLLMTLVANGALFGLALVWLNPAEALFQPGAVTAQALAPTLVLGLTGVAVASRGMNLPAAPA